MKSVIKSLQQENPQHMVLIVVLALFVLLDVDVPKPVANLVDTSLGNLAVMGAVLSLFMSKNPVLGIMGLIAGYELIKRSNDFQLPHAISKYVPSEKNKQKILSEMNEVPVTLEEEVVRKMVPRGEGKPLSKGTYKPILNDTHNATSV